MCGGSGLRLGLICTPHGRTLWRSCESLQHFSGAAGLCESHCKATRPRGSRGIHRRRLKEYSQPVGPDFIGMNRPRPLSAWIRKRIFPGANPPTLSQMMPPLFEPWNYSVLDVENLRLHYAQTLRHWRNRFERSTDRVAQMFGEQFVRLWRLYLAGSEAGFLSGSLQLFQILFAGAECRQIPWTRAHLYEKQKQDAK